MEPVQFCWRLEVDDVPLINLAITVAKPVFTRAAADFAILSNHDVADIVEFPSGAISVSAAIAIWCEVFRSEMIKLTEGSASLAYFDAICDAIGSTYYVLDPGGYAESDATGDDGDGDEDGDGDDGDSDDDGDGVATTTENTIVKTDAKLTSNLADVVTDTFTPLPTGAPDSVVVGDQYIIFTLPEYAPTEPTVISDPVVLSVWTETVN